MTRLSTISFRYISVVLITLMLLVQSGLVLHEVEHAVSGDNEHCLSCWVANHQHSYAADNFQFTFSQFTDFFIELSATILLFTHTFNFYISRAPPSSDFI